MMPDSLHQKIQNERHNEEKREDLERMAQRGFEYAVLAVAVLLLAHLVDGFLPLVAEL